MSFFNKFKSKKSNNDIKPLYLEKKYLESKLVAGNMKKIVSLPKYVDKNEWLAIHAFDFCMNLKEFCEVIREVCSHNPMMDSIGSECLWTDPVKKVASKVSAKQYTELAFEWMLAIIDDERVFPTKMGVEFDKDFEAIIRTFFKFMFRIICHLYNFHFEDYVNLDLDSHLNTLTSHFLYFGLEFDILERRDFSPLQELIDAWIELSILEKK
ncbi:Mob1/phocein [Rozella allomycis CSF55]|uniref:Mob1/phocein n=1 Tax=Rozella allomycis (strain CSF55) TaxID=988480 RepID=A0A075AVE0_ROZAC|nr:Mob1/phocein domain-containing protein [Rozella allomycis CSF55]RKP21606.1 Mob1/phocein [Rozella allomycis CSF55]|eukprot:EPZ32667.1 Mob1/phocein domain-containing protein [Rozella allomycis CSF55]